MGIILFVLPAHKSHILQPLRSIQELLLFSLLNIHDREHRSDHYSLYYLPNYMQCIHASNASCK